MMARPSLDQLIEEAAKLPPGPDAWAPIFRVYPELTLDQLAQKFNEAAERNFLEAAELRRYKDQRQK